MKKILIILLFFIIIYGVAVLLSMLMAKQKKIKPFIVKLPKFAVIAHRGASMRYPGNSMESFKEALKINPDSMLELDVQQTKDGIIVVNHDGNIDNIADGEGEIKDFTLRELQKFDAGYKVTFDNGKTFPFRAKGYKIPAFEEVLKNFKGTLISIDIKHHTIESAEKVINLVRNYGAEDNVIIGSFDNAIMDYVRKNHPDIATSFSKSEVIKFFLLNKIYLSGFFKAKDDAMMIPEFSDSENPEYLGPKVKQGFRIISKRFIKNAHALNLPVMAWTINRTENMERLYSWGIRGIVTDYPDLLTEIETIRKFK